MKKVSHTWMLLKIIEFLLAILLLRCVINYCRYTPLNFYNFSVFTSILICFYFIVYSVYLPLMRSYKRYKKAKKLEQKKNSEKESMVTPKKISQKVKSRDSIKKKIFKLKPHRDSRFRRETESPIRRRKTSSADINRTSNFSRKKLFSVEDISSQVVLTSNRKISPDFGLTGKKLKSSSFLKKSSSSIRRVYSPDSPLPSNSITSKKTSRKKRKKKPFYERSSWETKIVICLLLNSTNVLFQYYINFDNEIRPIITEEHLELKSRISQSIGAIFNPKYSRIARTDPIFFCILLGLSIVFFVRLNFSHLRPRFSHLTFFLGYSVVLYIVRCVIYASGSQFF